MNIKTTDKEMDAEIERLRNDPDVKLARKEMRLKYRKRQKLYALRNLAKRGAELRAEGYTLSNINDMFTDDEDDPLFMPE